MKVCNKCGLNKQDKSYFKRGKYLRSICKSCSKLLPYDKEYYKQRHILKREHLINLSKQWYKEHKKEGRLNAICYESAKRAKLYNAPGRFNRFQLVKRFNKFGNKCFYCHLKTKLEIDHKNPLCLGGTNYITNIVPACTPCNRKKGRYLLKS